MFNFNGKENTDITNSEVIKHTLISLIIVASSKTSKDYGWVVIKKMLRELNDRYSFLNFIKINKISLINYSMEDIHISSDFDKVKPKQVGMFIQDLIDLFKKYLGTKAGYFFIEEFKNILGEKYYYIIKEMGVDIRLIDLQKELYRLELNSYKIKESSDSNIAFVEKIK